MVHTSSSYIPLGPDGFGAAGDWTIQPGSPGNPKCPEMVHTSSSYIPLGPDGFGAAGDWTISLEALGIQNDLRCRTSATNQSPIDESHSDDTGEDHPPKKKRGRTKKIVLTEGEKADQLKSLLEELKASPHYQTLSEWRNHNAFKNHILDTWRASAPLRFQVIHHPSDITVSHYLPLFTQLASPISGPILVAADFKFLYPEISDDALAVGLRKCAPVIVKSAENCQRSRYHKDIPILNAALSCYHNKHTDEHDRLQFLLILLRFAIPAAGKRSKPKTLCKRQVVSKRDSQTSFIATPEQKGAHHQELILANSGFVQPYIAVLVKETILQAEVEGVSLGNLGENNQVVSDEVGEIDESQPIVNNEQSQLQPVAEVAQGVNIEEA
ncbi:hypothetical protein GE061_018306 [Apolygus lucorum]|uniref:Uncharacterized protein n=1 Tax=Apolygus lucorum TaxID=248454 RepID=A0A8S9XDJ6_APOLU|nr:hypothetical protein GE061_018306 [Apolygus lucorum]